MKNIAVLLPGIIRNYSHLEFINKMREFGIANNFNFYFFGYCYNFLGNGRHHWHFQREYNARKDLDINLIKSYSLSKLKITDQIIEKDKDGYDGRIISQWEGVKQSYLLYEEFVSETSTDFDLILRMRWDISVDCNKLKIVLNDCINDNKIRVVKYKTITDQGFVGSPNRVKDLCLFSEKYYELLSLNHFVNLQIQHRQFVDNIYKTNPRPRDHRNAHNLRFEPQSETMLTYYIDKNYKDVEKVILRHRHKWWELRRD